MEELIEKARNGDKEAYTELMKMIEWNLFRIACVELNDDIDEVNDAIQETMIRSFNNINKLTDNKSFKKWITTILINECRRIYAKRSRFDRLLQRYIITNNFDNLEQIRRVDDELDFQYAINKLKKEDKLLITLRFQSDFTIPEIAKILNMNVNTVKTKLRRAELRIKENLEKGECRNGRK